MREVRREVENGEVADEANFDIPVGFASRGDKSRLDENGSGATPVDVSANGNPWKSTKNHPKSDKVRAKNYQNC